MKIEDFKSGYFLTQDSYKYFKPEPINHSWRWEDTELNILLERANRSLGGLSSYSELIPNIDIYIRLHIKTEAHKSNKIEGTKTSIQEEMMKVEDVSPERRNDHIEVENYIAALDHGINRISVDDFPLSIRLINEIHEVLLKGVRGEHKTPGEIRRSQNWIGGSMPSTAAFVPPIHQLVPELLSDLERFIHNEKIQVPDLIKLAIIHYQFETIHPYQDGNGRIGRLIVPLYLLNYRILSKPCFYISDYFERNRILYYSHLNNVRFNNKLMDWIKFFLRAVIDTSETAKLKFQKVVDYVSNNNSLQYQLTGRPENISKVLQSFYNNPLSDINSIAAQTNLSRNAINNIVRQLVQQNIIIELTGYSRNRIFLLHEYFNIFTSDYKIE
ncbi:MAG: Fic family protein [Peptostreptococcaceae bacterium]|nr:Fic family protein [Peptostreptococcaceae bacterium]